MNDPESAIFSRRSDQAFPSLEPAEIEGLRRFGLPRRYAEGEALSRAGEAGHGLTILISGQVALSWSDETGRRHPVVTHRAGSFMGELAQLSGRPALLDAIAETPVEAIVIPPECTCAPCWWPTPRSASGSCGP